MLVLRNKEGAPYRAIAALGCVHGAGLLLSSFSVLNVASLVGIANGLFLLNSLLAVAAAARLLRSPAIRTGSVFLAACFLILFALADRTALLVAVTVLLLSLKDEGGRARSRFFGIMEKNETRGGNGAPVSPGEKNACSAPRIFTRRGAS